MSRAPEVRTVILAGGRGARLAPLTTIVPKPLVPVGEQPILELLLRQLVAQGCERITITLGHLGHLIRAVVDDGQAWGARVDYTQEAEPLGTAGALALLEDLHPDDLVLAINGDTLTDLRFDELVEAHRASGAAATIAVARRHVPVDFGVIETDERGDLVAYREKPLLEYLVSIGVNVFDANELSLLDDSNPVNMPDFLLGLHAAGRRVVCRETDSYWLDLGRIDDLRAAAETLETARGRFSPGS
jgi:NDP-sugar pyrophosphorylase family protein